MPVLAKETPDSPPSAPNAGLAAWDPPSTVVRNPETSSWKKPIGSAGNEARAPP
jgi:hypothetical protein